MVTNVYLEVIINEQTQNTRTISEQFQNLTEQQKFTTLSEQFQNLTEKQKFTTLS